MCILNFSTILIKHSYSHQLYASFDHLSTLLTSCNASVVAAVMDLLLVLYKRTVYMGASSSDRKPAQLKQRLSYLTENWGGAEHGISLAQCAVEWPNGIVPDSLKNLLFEFTRTNNSSDNITSCSQPSKLSDDDKSSISDMIQIEIPIHLISNCQNGMELSNLMENLNKQYQIPTEYKEQLWFRLKLAMNMGSLETRRFCIQARLLAVGVSGSYFLVL